jgi:hypothetical protein
VRLFVYSAAGCWSFASRCCYSVFWELCGSVLVSVLGEPGALFTLCCNCFIAAVVEGGLDGLARLFRWFFGVDAGVCVCCVTCILLRDYSLGWFFCLRVVFKGVFVRAW